MNAGDLRHRITIQQPTVAQDSYGEPVPTWSTFATVWAAAEPATGREYWANQQVTSELSVRFRIRHRTGITPSMRVSWDSRLFDIENIIPDPTNRREIHLMTREVQDA